VQLVRGGTGYGVNNFTNNGECYRPTHFGNPYYAVLRKGNGPVEDSCAKRFAGVFARGKMALIGHAPVCAAFARRTARAGIPTYSGPLGARTSP
jgi:hypothetical protein